MSAAELNIIKSSKSQSVAVDGYRFDIGIFRLETEQAWTLEVVDHTGTSHVWEDSFPSETDARNAAITALELAGAKAFMTA